MSSRIEKIHTAAIQDTNGSGEHLKQLLPIELPKIVEAVKCLSLTPMMQAQIRVCIQELSTTTIGTGSEGGSSGYHFSSSSLAVPATIMASTVRHCLKLSQLLAALLVSNREVAQPQPPSTATSTKSDSTIGIGMGMGMGMGAQSNIIVPTAVHTQLPIFNVGMMS